MDKQIDMTDSLPQDDRLPYERPELLDAGKISDVTLSNGNNNGADAAYS